MTGSRFPSLTLAVAMTMAAASFCLPKAATARPLDDVVKSGYIDIAVYEDFKPYSWSESGEPKGIDVDIIREVASRMKLEPRVVVRRAGETLDADLRYNIWRGELSTFKMVDVMMHVPQDKGLKQLQEGEAEPRNDLVHFCCSYQLESFGVIADPKVLTVNTFAPFVYNKIGVEVDTVPDFFLTNAFNGQLMQSIVRRSTFNETIDLWEDNKVSAVMALRAQVEWMAKQTKREARVASPPTPNIVRRDWPVGMAVRTDSRDLGYEIDLHLEAMAKEGKLAEIMSNYGVTYTPIPTN